MMIKMKGQIAGLVGMFLVALFVVLFVFIFIFAFKIHVTQSMVDYYLWSKEYDIPMALFSTDVNEESPAVALNRIFYKSKFGYDEWVGKTKDILDRWFIERTSQKTYQFYHFELGNVVLEEEVGCDCKASAIPASLPTRYECAGNDCGSHQGEDCDTTSGEPDCTEYCVGKACKISTLQRNNLGLYPTPIVFNGTTRVVPLKFDTIIYEKELK